MNYFRIIIIKSKIFIGGFKQMKKELKFGFDIGETSLGWSVLDSQTKEIVALGVRAWDKSEDRKGRGLNEIRTEKSNVRKTLRRRKHRKVKRIFKK